MNLVAEVPSSIEDQADISQPEMPEFVPGEPFVHMHIPKTAGTSLRRMFEAQFGTENVLLPSEETGQFLRSSDLKYSVPRNLVGTYEHVRRAIHALGLSAPMTRCMQTLRSGNVAQKPNFEVPAMESTGFSVMLGHFTGDLVRSKQLDDYPVTTVLREPLERSISFYRHWHRTGGVAFSDIFGELSVEDTSFEDVAFREELTNFQSRWIGDVALARVGVVEKLGEFLESIGVQQKLLKANQDPSNHRKPHGDAGFIREFTEANTQDYELYHRTVEAWS